MPNQTTENAPKTGTSKRGFASMDPQRQREIASQGGRAAHLSGHAHEFTPEEARAAGRKGGEAVSRDRRHMAQIGAEGGRASHGGGRGAAQTEAQKSLEQQQPQPSPYQGQIPQ